MTDNASHALTAAPLLAVGSGRGGSGKSTVALALAHAFTSEHRRRVALVDLDPQASCSQYAGARAVSDPLKAAPVKRHGFLVYCGGEAMATASPSAIRALLSRAAAGSDLVIADLPPALTQQAHEAVLRQPATLLVLTAELEPGSIQPAEKLKQMALAAGVPVRVLCNKLNVRAVSHATLLALKGAHGDRVSDILIKDATVAPESIMRGLPVTLYKPKAPTSLALFAFARELAEEGLV